MTLELETALRLGLASLFEPAPKETASEWCCKNLNIPPPHGSGPFSLAGREYMRRPIDLISNPVVADIAMCFGSQTGKTTGIMAGLAARLARDAVAAIWAMPNRDLAKSFSKTRWMPLVRASPGLIHLIPVGAARHSFAALEQKLGASLLNFLGSNSAANLSSRPAPIVIADEVDKFNEGTRKEADAVNLLEQRTKDFANPKRIKASTPTVSDALIWQEYLKGTQERYFLPCPSCGNHVVFAWSKHMTVMKLTGKEAFVAWDKEAKRANGTWDLDRVRRSARAECWSCGKHIQDGHKTRMIREGVWLPTNPAAEQTFISLHLPSLYAASPETTFGRLAVKFIQAKKSLLGVQGFINGELAEPWESQDVGSERVEIITPADAPPIADKVIRYIGADFQEIRPHWAVCREFDANGNNRLVDWFTWENWNELRAKQIELGVDDQDVGIDSGHKATEIYSECARYGQRILLKSTYDQRTKRYDVKSEWIGWTPMKGREQTAFWLASNGVKHIYGIIDVPDFPQIQLLEFNGHFFKDIFDRMRRGKTQVRCEFNHRADETYFKHLDGDIRRSVWDAKIKRVKWVWEPRTKQYPIHLKDCEIMIQALAMRAGILKIEAEEMK
jgi:hypothetical protein